MKSILPYLVKSGIKRPVNIPNWFQSYPKSLKEILRILQLPDPQITQWKRSSSNFDEDWTEEFQGLTHAWSNIWFFSNRDELLKVKWDQKGFQILKKIHRNSLGSQFKPYDHIGDIDYCNGLVFVPFEPVNWNNCAVLLAFSTDLKLVGWAELSGKKDNHAAWCAVNPWDKCVYTSDGSTDVSFFYVYDVSTLYKLRNQNIFQKQIVIKPKMKKFHIYKDKPHGTPDKIKDIQGGAFSPNGRLYITLATVTSRIAGSAVAWDNNMACYDALTGVQLGYMEIPHPDSTTIAAELEGITVHKGVNNVFIAHLDNELVGNDEIDILEYWHPNFKHQI
jgi:hypothetical protein